MPGTAGQDTEEVSRSRKIGSVWAYKNVEKCFECKIDTHWVGKTWTAWEGYTNMGIEGGTLSPRERDGEGGTCNEIGFKKSY